MVSPLNIFLAIGPFYTAFIMLRFEPSVSTFFRGFLMKGCGILAKAFSSSIEMIM
jgi:hypothetical protein